MSMVDRLIEQLRKRGLEVKPGKNPGELILCGPHSQATPEIMKALKAFKPQLLERCGKTETIIESNGTVRPANRESETQSEPDPEPELCRQCKRDVSDPENRERLIGPNPFCTILNCQYRKPNRTVIQTQTPHAFSNLKPTGLRIFAG